MSSRARPLLGKSGWDHGGQGGLGVKASLPETSLLRAENRERRCFDKLSGDERRPTDGPRLDGGEEI
jgi:hypothetical protein